MQMNNKQEIVDKTKYLYDVAFSFAGEQRSKVESIADILKHKGYKVFIDEYEQADLWGKDLYQHLQLIYRDTAKYCVVCISLDYANKMWTKHELKQAQARALIENREYILPLRFDDTKIPGLNDTTAYINYDDYETLDIVSMLIAKIENGNTPTLARPTKRKKRARLYAVLGVVATCLTILGALFGDNLIGRFINDDNIANHSLLTESQPEEASTSETFSAQDEEISATTDQVAPESFSGHWRPPQSPLTVPALRKNVQVVGGWTYFLYPITETYDEETADTWTYTALYRFKDDDTDVMLVSDGKCDDYQIEADSVYYVCHNMANYGGELCVSRTDGLAQVVLEDWIDKFLIVDDYIYFTYSHDTLGVGQEGHALHRMDLKGDNRIVVAYEVDGIGLKRYDSGKGYRHDFDTDGEHVYGSNYKMKLGVPANGAETLIVTDELIDGYDDEWIYYTTTMLMKCKRDGSQQYILDEGIDTDEDGISDSFFVITEVDSEWIYYYDQQTWIKEVYSNGYIEGKRRISKDGIIKEKVNE